MSRSTSPRSAASGRADVEVYSAASSDGCPTQPERASGVPALSPSSNRSGKSQSSPRPQRTRTPELPRSPSGSEGSHYSDNFEDTMVDMTQSRSAGLSGALRQGGAVGTTPARTGATEASEPEGGYSDENFYEDGFESTMQSKSGSKAVSPQAPAPAQAQAQTKQLTGLGRSESMSGSHYSDDDFEDKDDTLSATRSRRADNSGAMHTPGSERLMPCAVESSERGHGGSPGGLRTAWAPQPARISPHWRAPDTLEAPAAAVHDVRFSDLPLGSLPTPLAGPHNHGSASSSMAPPAPHNRAHDAIPRHLKAHAWDLASLGQEPPGTREAWASEGTAAVARGSTFLPLPDRQDLRGVQRQPVVVNSSAAGALQPAVEAQVVESLARRFLNRKTPGHEHRERTAYQGMLSQVAWTALEPSAAQEAAILLSDRWLSPISPSETLRAFRRCLHTILSDDRVVDILEHQMSQHFSRVAGAAH